MFVSCWMQLILLHNSSMFEDLSHLSRNISTARLIMQLYIEKIRTQIQILATVARFSQCGVITTWFPQNKRSHTEFQIKFANSTKYECFIFQNYL